MTARKWIVASAVAVLCLTGCSGGVMSTPSDAPASRPSFTPIETAPPTSNPAAPTSNPVEVPAARWDALAADLSERGVNGAPTLVSADAVTWQDGSLGCPAPGRSYTQALVEGMRVVVEVDGTRYDYRFGSGDRPVLCEGTPAARG